MSDKLWGGRFSSDITEDVLKYTETVSVDHRMLESDLWQNIAHVLMLGRQGINSDEETAVLLSGLLTLEGKRAEGNLQLNVEHEDVHLNTENMLIALVGEVGGRMHTARSRNDQVQTDARMVSRNWLLDAVEELAKFGNDLFECSAEEREMIIPGYTHSQAAQPISVAFWKAAHGFALLRDGQRLKDAWKRVNNSPLGSCALAGTTFKLDRKYTAELLGFNSFMLNALDATSTRDWTVEIAAAIASGATNISRMQEEIVTWSSNEYALMEVHDSFATGSSIMPHKKNPVVAELARGKSGRAVGALVQLLVMEKSVGLGYSCDLQEDKPVYWSALDSYLETVKICRDQNSMLQFDPKRGAELCWDNFSTATELANTLVSEFGFPFRVAHRITGDVVASIIGKGETLRNTKMVSRILCDEHQIDLAEKRLVVILDPMNTLRSYRSTGATGPDPVLQQQKSGTEEITRLRQWAREMKNELTRAKEQTLSEARTLVASTTRREMGAVR
jgi:argininosuccinate lyase